MIGVSAIAIPRLAACSAALAFHFNQRAEVGADRYDHDLNVGEDIHGRIAVEPMFLKYQVFWSQTDNLGDHAWGTARACSQTSASVLVHRSSS